MELSWHDLIRVVRERWWIVVMAAIILAAAGFGYGVIGNEDYTATARVTLLPATDIPDPYAALLAAQSLTPTYQQLLTSDLVLERVQGELGLSYTLSELESRIRTVIIPNSLVIEVQATDVDPERAAEIANSLVDQFQAYIHVPSASVTDGMALTAPVQVIDRAATPSDDGVGRPGRLAILGTIAGALAGTAIVGVLELLHGDSRRAPIEAGRLSSERQRSNQSDLPDVSTNV